MDNTKNSFISVDNNYIINKNHIRWIKKSHNDVFEICTLSTGCTLGSSNTHKISKQIKPNEYRKIELIIIDSKL